MHASSKPRIIPQPVLGLHAETMRMEGERVWVHGKLRSTGEDYVIHPATTILEIRSEDDRFSFLAWCACHTNFGLYSVQCLAVCAKHCYVACGLA